MTIRSRVADLLFAKKPDASPAPRTAALWSDTATNELIDLLTRIPETDELLLQAGIARASLRKLETDDEIFQALRTRREAVVATPWRLEGGDEKLSELLTEELKPLMEQIVSGAWRAVPFGYSVMEAVYRRREDGRYGLATVTSKPIEWFDPRPDGSLRYFPEDGMSPLGVECDQVYKFFLTRVEPSYHNPKGEALLSRLYWPWFFRFNSWRFWGQFLERFGQPLLTGKSSSPAKMAQALLAAHQDAVIAIGPNDEVAAISPSTSGEAFEKLEQAVVRRFQKVILGQTLTSDTGAKGGGSYALGKVHAEVREGLRQADIRLVRRTAQNIVNALCAVNGATKDIPELVFADDAGLEEARAERDAKLASIGVKLRKEYFLERYDLREDDFDVASASAPEEGTTPGATTEGATAVQDTALNGAQVTSLLEVIGRVMDGDLSAEAAKAIIRSAFPAIKAEDVELMVDAVIVGKNESEVSEGGVDDTLPEQNGNDDLSDRSRLRGKASKGVGGAVPTDEEGEPTNPQAKMGRSGYPALMFARKRKADPKRFTAAQQKIEELADDALAVSGQPVHPELIRSAVLAARDPEDLENRLSVLMAEDNAMFRSTLESALFVADVIGYANSDGKI